MNRLRRLALLPVLAGVLLTATARPAQAQLFEGATLAAVATWLYNTMSNGAAALDAVLLAIETELPIIEAQVQMKTETNISMARSAAMQQRFQRQAYWFTMQQLMPDPLQANCQAKTAISDAAVVEDMAPKLNEKIMGLDLNNFENRGGALSGGPSVDRGVAVQAEAKHHTCTYGDENDLVKAKADGCPIQTPEAIKANPYKDADQMATTLTNTQAFDEDKHYTAAMDYCLAMIGNQPLDYAGGQALMAHVENWRQFLVSLSGKAARSMAADTCTNLVGRKLPLDSAFARADPAFARGFTAAEQEMQAGADKGKRGLDDIDASARKYLLDPASGAPYTEIDPKAPKAGDLPAGAQNALIKGQKISREQNDIAMYIYRPMAGSTVRGTQGTQNQQMSQLLQSRAANLQLMWRQYASLERQLMFESISLARSVQNAPGFGDPAPSSPNQ